MANKSKETEHSGAKHGCGAYWGPKADAKKESKKLRRQQDKQIARQCIEQETS